MAPPDHGTQPAALLKERAHPVDQFECRTKPTGPFRSRAQPLDRSTGSGLAQLETLAASQAYLWMLPADPSSTLSAGDW